MTETLDYGVRYITCGDVVIEPATSLAEAKAAAPTLYPLGLVPEIVTRPSAPWTVHEAVTLTSRRETVESVIDLLVQEEISHESAAEELQYMASGLLTDKQAAGLRKQGVHVNDECTLSIWMERAANHYRLRIDPPPGRDSNDESSEADYLTHLDVLAGVVDHGRAEYDCSACAGILPAAPSVKAVA